MTFLDITDKANAIRYHGNKSKRVGALNTKPASLDQYTGSYYSRELETTYRIYMENGKLMCHQMRLGDFNLAPDLVAADQFSGDAGSFSFTRIAITK